jgi:arsenate reductase
MKVLILCTGNTCRSQMAEGYLRSLDPSLELYSAGTEPGGQVHPLAVKVMRERGIDIRGGYPKAVEEFLEIPFDYVITVCDGAKEACPVFTGEVKHRLHIGFDDPAEATGTEAEVLAVFRRVRDEIFRDFGEFYREELDQHPADPQNNNHEDNPETLLS